MLHKSLQPYQKVKNLLIFATNYGIVSIFDAKSNSVIAILKYHGDNYQYHYNDDELIFGHIRILFDAQKVKPVCTKFSLNTKKCSCEKCCKKLIRKHINDQGFIY